jgi:hypothetical protein
MSATAAAASMGGLDVGDGDNDDINCGSCSPREGTSGAGLLAFSDERADSDPQGSVVPLSVAVVADIVADIVAAAADIVVDSVDANTGLRGSTPGLRGVPVCPPRRRLGVPGVRGGVALPAPRRISRSVVTSPRRA